MESKESKLKIKPIGGFGQIGSNMVQFTGPKSNFIIDAGILFPLEDTFGIQYLIPDLSEITAPTDIIITHGHEDHIGAIVHFIKKFPKSQIWAPPYAAELIESRLGEFSCKSEINIYKHGDRIQLNDYIVTPLSVNHSIPHTFGLHIMDHSGDLSIFYASDFRIDTSSSFEKPFDLKYLQKISAKSKIRLLMADSTNILTTKHSNTEFNVKEGLSKIIAQKFNRYFITLFSSNIQRIQSIVDAASSKGLKIIPIGRSVISHINSAKKLNLLNDPQGLIHLDPNSKIYPENSIYILSGCQGDYKGAFRRIVANEWPGHPLCEDDCFIFSAKSIPGNEKKVGLLLNAVAESGAKLFTNKDIPVHASGHACRDDLLKLYKSYSPTHAAPVHGESYFLYRHKDFIEENIPNCQTFLLTNYDELHLNDQLKFSTKIVEAPFPTLIYGEKRIPIERAKVSQKRKIAQGGMAIFSLSLSAPDKFKHSYIGLPETIENIHDKIDHLIRKSLNSYNKTQSKESMEESLRIQIRKIISSYIGQRPVVLVHIL